MNEVIQAMLDRRSCKSFDSSKVVEADKLEQIVEAGLWAANGMGKQGTHIVVVQDPEDVKTLSKLNAAVMGSKANPFYGATTVCVVLGDKSVATHVEDGALTMGNLMLAAHALGVGSCWIHRAQQVFDSEEGKALLAKWGIEGDWRGVGHCVLGYPTEGYTKAAAERKDGRVTYVK